MKRYLRNIKDAQGSKEHGGFMKNRHDDVRSNTWQMKEKNDFLYVEKVLLPLVLNTCYTFLNFFVCDPCRIHRFCTRVGLAILEYHCPIDEYKLQIA